MTIERDVDVEGSWIPLARPPIEDSDIARVVDVLRSGQLVQGPVVAELENLLAQRLGVEHAVLVSSGTAALHLALLAIGAGPGDEVIVPAFSFVASANSVVLCGATPVFCDVRLDDLNIDPGLIESAITPQTRAVMAVHEFGSPADVAAILEICERHGLVFLEDAACGLGSAVDGKSVGTFGSLGCYSFHPRKVTTSGEGGLVVTNESHLADQVRSMRNHGMDSSGVTRSYVRAGFNYRLTEIQAALMMGQIERLDASLAKRRELAMRYSLEIANPIVRRPSEAAGTVSTWQSYHVLTKSRKIRDSLAAHLADRHIESSVGAQCIPNELYYRKNRGLSGSSFPMALAAHERGLVLPLFDTLSEVQATRVIEAVNDFEERDDLG